MIFIFRFAHWLHKIRVPILPKLLYIFNRVVFSVVLPPSTQVGKQVLFGYNGLGIVVHARTVIGDRVKIGQNVTIGGRSDLNDVPVLEDDVDIGAGACVLGPVRVGRGAKVGANAVVLVDVPAGATAVGVPARVLLMKDMNFADSRPSS